MQRKYILQNGNYLSIYVIKIVFTFHLQTDYIKTKHEICSMACYLIKYVIALVNKIFREFFFIPPDFYKTTNADFN